MSIENTQKKGVEGGVAPKAEQSSPASQEAIRNKERTDKIGRMGALVDGHASEIGELLLGEGREKAAGDVSMWFKEKRKNYKNSVQGGPADPELSALTLMAGLAAERNRESSLDPNMDKDVAAEIAEKAQFAAKIFDQEMVVQNAFGTKPDVKRPNSLDDLVSSTRDAASLPSGFNGIGSDVAFLQERLRELQQGKASSREVLTTVNTIFHGLNYSSDSLVGCLERLADPTTDPAEKRKLLQGIEKLNKTVSALQAVRRQLEAAVYEKGAEDPSARAKIDTLREAVAGSGKAEKSPAAQTAQREAVAGFGKGEKAPVAPEQVFVVGKQIDFGLESPLGKKIRSANTVEEIHAMMTPEIKQAGLQRFLHEVDETITDGKRIFAKSGSLIERRLLGHIFGPGISGTTGTIYQRFLAAATGSVSDLPSLAKMNAGEFSKRVFGYDLAKDPKRKADLEKYTSFFMKS